MVETSIKNDVLCNLSSKYIRLVSFCVIFYAIKYLADGKIDKYKARLVAQGFSQKDRIDFYSDDLFAPVTRLTTVRLLLQPIP